MKGKFEDLAGKKFGRLTVEGYMGRGRWWCNCECGGTAIVRTDGLKSGHTKSCGCFHKDSVTKHGFWNKAKIKDKGADSKLKRGNRFYSMWQSMKARCTNPKLKCYKNYGGRGITYDLKWEDFEGFKEDMYFKYLYLNRQYGIKNPSLERKDVNGNYNKENCTFIEHYDQLKNTRSVITFIAFSPKGDKYVLRNVNEFCDKYGLNSSHVYECLRGKATHHKGWTFKKSKLRLKNG